VAPRSLVNAAKIFWSRLLPPYQNTKFHCGVKIEQDSETPVDMYQAALYHIPKNRILNTHRRDKTES
jgi:hypothetical protein